MLPTAYGEPTAIVPPGLATAEARKRLGEYGANTVIEKPLPPWQVFLAKFWSPIAWMLEAAIILQLWVSQYIEAAVIGGLLLFNATCCWRAPRIALVWRRRARHWGPTN